ncbi:hypothetical protein [Sphaerisporangium perillae]|uniref:hypothetical protein n=1 Tax=Sphaerisporangium perillae TaxID=2935860 RepID=UPI00200DBDA0|nr:hypothetical protein [Sphaerisporangium perillae]
MRGVDDLGDVVAALLQGGDHARVTQLRDVVFAQIMAACRTQAKRSAHREIPISWAAGQRR